MMGMNTRVGFVLGLLATCWLGMMLVHECGHMLAALCTGGAVTQLQWPAWGFSRTEVSPNPHPLLVAWGGPVFGAVLPAAVALVLWRLRQRLVTVEIFSGFCLLANGVYVSAGSLGRVGDAGEMLKYGSPMWVLWAVGVPVAAGGLLQWHGLGPGFGMARVGKREAYMTAALGAALLAASLACQRLNS